MRPAVIFVSWFGACRKCVSWWANLTVVAHLAEMRSHGIARLLASCVLDRVKNSLVMNLPALGPAGDVENSQPLLPQKGNDGIEQRKDERIVRALGQRQMKIEIGFDVGFRILTGRSIVATASRMVASSGS
jgi:hypothetical protein